MKLKAKATPEGFILEEVNPYVKEDRLSSDELNNLMNKEYYDFELSKKSYFTDDPDLKEGVIVDSEDYELIFQQRFTKDFSEYTGDRTWTECSESYVSHYKNNPIISGLKETRLLARKKVNVEAIINNTSDCECLQSELHKINDKYICGKCNKPYNTKPGISEFEQVEEKETPEQVAHLEIIELLNNNYLSEDEAGTFSDDKLIEYFDDEYELGKKMFLAGVEWQKQQDK